MFTVGTRGGGEKGGGDWAVEGEGPGCEPGGAEDSGLDVGGGMGERESDEVLGGGLDPSATLGGKRREPGEGGEAVGGCSEVCWSGGGGEESGEGEVNEAGGGCDVACWLVGGREELGGCNEGSWVAG